jgi:hypothetical protein
MAYIVIRTDGAEATVTMQGGEAEAALAQGSAAPGGATPPSEMLAAAVAAAGAQDAGPGPAAAPPTTTGAPPLPFAAAEPDPPRTGSRALDAGAAPGTQAEPPPATVTVEGGE